jgi:HEAT repeat protein
MKLLRTDKNVKVRKAALYALEYGAVAGTSGLPAVIAAAENDEDAMVRQEAVMLLGRLGPKTNGALKTLAGRLHADKSDAVRESAATAIGKNFTIQAPDYIGVLIEGLQDKHPGTRTAVAVALRNMGGGAAPAFPAMLESTKDAKELVLVRAACLHVLTRHAKENPKLVPVLIDLLKDKETPAEIREASAEGLGRVGASSAEIVNLFGDTISDKEVVVRKAVASSLVSLGVAAMGCWPAARTRLKYTNKEGAAIAPVESDSNVREQLIRWAGAIGKVNADAIDVLVEAAQYDISNENRIGALQELGEIGRDAKAALPAIQKIANEDSRASIRTAAAKAYKLINR